MAAKKASGRNVKNSERSTSMVLLRLDPELAERFRATHLAWKKSDPTCTLGDVLEAALDALDASTGSRRRSVR